MLDNYSISGVTQSSQRTVNSDPKLPVVSTNSVNGTPDIYQTELSQLTIIWKMRWFFVIVIVIWIFAAISITAEVICITRNPFSFSLYTTLAPLVYMLQRIIKYLFPRDDKDYRLEKAKVQR